MVNLFKNVRSSLKLRKYAAKLSMFVQTREQRNINLAQRLAVSQGITEEHFADFTKKSIERMELQMELSNTKFLSHKEAIVLPVECRGLKTLRFYHGFRLKLVQSFWGDYFVKVPCGVMQWDDGAFITGVRTPFIDPFPKDDVLRKRRDDFLASYGFYFKQQ